MQGNMRMGSPMASMPEYVLRFLPPLVIRNCLPYQVRVVAEPVPPYLALLALLPAGKAHANGQLD